MSKWLNNVGQILESKAGKLYIKFDEDLEIKKGDTLVMKNHADEIQKSVEEGRLSEDFAQELLEKTSFVKYKLDKPPRDAN